MPDYSSCGLISELVVAIILNYIKLIILNNPRIKSMGKTLEEIILLEELEEILQHRTWRHIMEGFDFHEELMRIISWSPSGSSAQCSRLTVQVWHDQPLSYHRKVSCQMWNNNVVSKASSRKGSHPWGRGGDIICQQMTFQRKFLWASRAPSYWQLFKRITETITWHKNFRVYFLTVHRLRERLQSSQTVAPAANLFFNKKKIISCKWWIIVILNHIKQDLFSDLFFKYILGFLYRC